MQKQQHSLFPCCDVIRSCPHSALWKQLNLIWFRVVSLRKKCFALEYSAHHGDRGFNGFEATLCLTSVRSHELCDNHVTMPYTTHFFFATHRSYAPFKLHRTTHVKIRSGQLQITSQHENIGIATELSVWLVRVTIYWGMQIEPRLVNSVIGDGGRGLHPGVI